MTTFATLPAIRSRAPRRWPWFVFLLVLGLCIGRANAQVVRLANHATAEFAGWNRATIDRKPAHTAGIAKAVDNDGDSQTVHWVLGRPIGLGTWAVDLHVTLAPGRHIVVDLSTSEPWKPRLAPPRTDSGPLRANGTKIPALTIAQDGAAWTVHGRTRIDRMLMVDVWLRSYGEPWAHGECVVTASNPLVEDVAASLPIGLSLTIDGAVVLPLGGSPGLIVPPGTAIGDGQARAVPFVVVWPDELGDAGLLAFTQADGTPRLWGVGAVGIETLHPTGNARHDDAAAARTIGLHTEAAHCLYDWREGVLGIPPWSGRTGAQEDQLTHGEAMLAGGAGAERTVYLCALKWANRWCHHLEATGAQLEPSLHPRLLMWDGRPHTAGGDMLGKKGAPVASGDWRGPDVEHWLIQRLYESARLTGSPACQWLLSAQARLYLTQWTVTPGLYTSQAYAARARGYEGLNAVELFVALEDRALAERVRSHWLDRWAKVLAPACEGDVWDVRHDDPRLGTGAWWMPWQQALGCWGLDVAGEAFGAPAARAAALRAARRVLADAWADVDGTWLSRAQMPVDGARPTPDGSFNYYGMSLAVAVVRRQDAADARAAAIWSQLEASAKTAAQWSWMAPGVR